MKKKLLLWVSALAGLMVLGIAVVLADAPDPVPAAATASIGPRQIINGVATRAVTVQGQWKWTTHTSDCNSDRSGVGYAVDWGDPDQAGNHVTTLGTDSIDVGAAAANDYNPADNEVHPTPAVAGTNTVFNDPDVTPPTDTSRKVWRSGCGTYSAANDYNSGTWGPITHVYTEQALLDGVTICAIMYDVHGSDANTTTVSNGFAGGVPNNAKEITAGGSNHNGDNGAEDNENTPLGNTCAQIDMPPLPEITVDKTSPTTTLPPSGGSVTFTFTVTNTGPVSVTITSLTDDKFGTLTGDADCKLTTVLAAGAGCSFNQTFTVPAGAAFTTHVDTFTAIAVDANDVDATDSDDHTITYLPNSQPAIQVDKTSPTTTIPTTGGSVTFTYTVTNTGPVAVTITTLSDDKFGTLAGDADCQVGTPLAVGASCSFNATFNVPAGTAQTTHTNVFTAVATDANNNIATDDDPHAIAYVATPTPAVLVDKTSPTTTLPTSGGSVTFTYTVTNTGPIAVTITTLSDDKFGTLAGDADCQVGTPLAVGASCSFNATFNVPAGTAQTTHTNVFTAVVTDANQKTATDDDPHTITYIASPLPAVLVDKTSATTVMSVSGGNVTFTFTVTNTGPVTVSITSLSDDKFGTLTGDNDCKVGTSLAAGAFCTFDATLPVPAGVAQTTHTNVFTAQVVDANQNTASDNDPHTITYVADPLPALRVDKTSVTNTLPTSGGSVTFTFTVTNTGPVAVSITALNDDKFGALSGDADCQIGTPLAIGAFCTFDATFNVPAGTALTTHVNTFTAEVKDAKDHRTTASDPHSITYLADPLPVIRVDKTSLTNSLPTSGGQVTFTFTVTNTGPVAVTITSLNDDKFGALTGDADCQVGTQLAVGASCTFDAAFTVPAGAALATHVNTFTAVVTDANDHSTSASDPHTITYVADPLPALRVDKTSVTNTLPVAGGPATFTFTVTNVGPVAVTITSLNDDKFGALAGDADCQVGTPLGVGASCTFDATFNVPAGTALATHVNTFTAVVKDAKDHSTSASDPHSITYVADPLPAVRVDKTSVTSTLPVGGGPVTFTFTVTNVGPVSVTITSLNDDRFGALTGDADCQVGTPLGVGASCSFSAAFTVPGGVALATHVNTFTAVVTDAKDHSTSASDPHTITYVADPLPSVRVDKTSAITILPASGGSVTFTYTVTNSGPVAVTITSLNDDKFGALVGDADCQVGTPLAVGASCTFDATFTVPAGTALSTHVNTFTAVVKDPQDHTATGTDTHTITYVAEPLPSVRVDKTSVTTTLPASGGSVTFTYTVTNSGPVPATITSLTDDKFGTLAGDADCKVGTPLAVGASCTFDATFTVPAGTALATHVNTFTAVVTDAQQHTATASDSHTITYVADPLPSVRVDKTSVTTTLPTSGGPVTFTYTVTNTGPVPVTITTLTDDKFGTLVGDADCKVGTVLAVGASCNFNGTFTVPAGAALGTHVNTFTAVVTDNKNHTTTGNDNHTITYLADPLPAVRVDKTSPTTSLPVGGGSVTFTYTVTNAGPVSVTITSLTDDRFGALVGDADCKVGTALAVGASCTFDATFTVPAGAALGTHVNTFTAVVTDPKQRTTTGTDSHTITYAAPPPPPVTSPTPAPTALAVLAAVPPRLPNTGTGGGVDPTSPSAASNQSDWRQLLGVLEANGYVRREGDDWELTPKGVKMVTRRAAEEAYQAARTQAGKNVTLPISWLAAGTGLLVCVLLVNRSRRKRGGGR